MKLQPKNHLSFITGGHAHFTIRNSDTGNRFTYQVTIPGSAKPEDTPIYFVKVLTGQSNETDYSYIGCIKKNPLRFEWGVKSKVSREAISVKAFDFVFNGFVRHGFSRPNLEIWHEGVCCRCGRKLTVPESIESGIGPECASIKANHKQYKLKL